MPSQVAVDSGCPQDRVVSLYTRRRPDFESAAYPRVRPGYCAAPLHPSDEVCVPCNAWTGPFSPPPPPPGPMLTTTTATARSPQAVHGNTTACEDISGGMDMAGWTDSDGLTCEVYVVGRYCNANGKLGGGWQSDWGVPASYANANGVDAFRGCCGCGGGSIPFVPQCEDMAGWTDSSGVSCVQYAKMAYCTADGKPGAGWQQSAWGMAVGYADPDGVDAFGACCACGGAGAALWATQTSGAGSGEWLGSGATGRSGGWSGRGSGLPEIGSGVDDGPVFTHDGPQLYNLPFPDRRPTTAPFGDVPNTGQHSKPLTTAASSADGATTASFATPAAIIGHEDRLAWHIVDYSALVALLLTLVFGFTVLWRYRRERRQRRHRSSHSDQELIPLETVLRDLPLAESVAVCEHAVDDAAAPPQPPYSTLLDQLEPQHQRFATLPKELARDQITGIVRLDSGQFGVVYKARFDPGPPSLPCTVVRATSTSSGNISRAFLNSTPPHMHVV